MIIYDQVEIIIPVDSSLGEEIKRNAKIILTTLAGTVPFMRDFGISPDIIDLPMNEAEGAYMMECITKIRKYEPRASVVEIDFTSSLEGKLYPKVVLSSGLE